MRHVLFLQLYESRFLQFFYFVFPQVAPSHQPMPVVGNVTATPTASDLNALHQVLTADLNYQALLLRYDKIKVTKYFITDQTYKGKSYN